MNKLYLDCQSGISGDMFVGAMLDLGADQIILNHVLKSLPVSGYNVVISKVIKNGIKGCDFNVILEKAFENHDHDMIYLHENNKNYYFENTQKIIFKRYYADIYKIIQEADMNFNAKNIAVRILKILAESVAVAHHIPIDEVCFHEIGAIDTIVDIISAAVCIDNLKIKEVIVPILYEGTGTIRCQHGILSIPVPAVTNIIRDYNIAIHKTNVEGELITPTGAAIVAAIHTTNKLPEQFNIVKVGIGTGKRNYKSSGILKAVFI